MWCPAVGGFNYSVNKVIVGDPNSSLHEPYRVFLHLRDHESSVPPTSSCSLFCPLVLELVAQVKRVIVIEGERFFWKSGGFAGGFRSDIKVEGHS